MEKKEEGKRLNVNTRGASLNSLSATETLHFNLPPFFPFPLVLSSHFVPHLHPRDTASLSFGKENEKSLIYSQYKHIFFACGEESRPRSYSLLGTYPAGCPTPTYIVFLAALRGLSLFGGVCFVYIRALFFTFPSFSSLILVCIRCQTRERTQIHHVRPLQEPTTAAFDANTT